MIAQRLFMGVVRGYRLLLSPWLGSSCRFEPTCSAYALQALELHGAAKGSYLTVHRLVRCGPWCNGGHDPVPKQALRLFSDLLPPTSSKKTP
jgi:putative membrane protein insertion efficiency factor